MPIVAGYFMNHVNLWNMQVSGFSGQFYYQNLFWMWLVGDNSFENSKTIVFISWLLDFKQRIISGGHNGPASGQEMENHASLSEFIMEKNFVIKLVTLINLLKTITRNKTSSIISKICLHFPK